MTYNYELVVSLSTLTVPPLLSNEKLKLSVSQPPKQYFSQGGRVVKGGKINFYRENLFIGQTGQGFTFNLYQNDPKGQERHIAGLPVTKEDLQQVNRKPTAFRTAVNGFQLAWDCWLFSEDLSSLDPCSERDYTELDLPINCPESSTSIVLGSISQNRGASCSRRPPLLKRSGSTDEASSRGSRQLGSSPSENKAGEEGGEEGGEKGGEKAVLLRPPRLSQVTSLEKRKPHIKSQLYSSLVAGISGLLSQKKLA